MLNVTGNPNVDLRLAKLYGLIGNRRIRKGQYLGHLWAYQLFLIREFYGPGHSVETIRYRDLLFQELAREEARIIKTELSPIFFQKVRAEGHKDLYSFLVAQGHVYHYDPAYGKPLV